MAHTQVTDGRAARSARTRTAVVDAMLSLIADGDLRPTARRIAERAGVSLRSVYVHFEDLEDLFLAAAERQVRRVAAEVGPLRASGDLDDRLRALAEHRAAILETTGNVRRAAAVQEPFSEALASLFERARRRERDELRHTFAAELDALAPAARDLRLDALEVLFSAASYDRLRRGRGRSDRQIVACWRRSGRALLTEDDH